MLRALLTNRLVVVVAGGGAPAERGSERLGARELRAVVGRGVRGARRPSAERARRHHPRQETGTGNL